MVSTPGDRAGAGIAGQRHEFLPLSKKNQDLKLFNVALLQPVGSWKGARGWLLLCLCHVLSPRPCPSPALQPLSLDAVSE